MTGAWDGYPKNRKQSGWHWLADERGPEPDYWIADLQGWRYVGLPERAKVRAAGYLGPCHSPSEVAAIKTERDKLRDALDGVMNSHGEQLHDAFSVARTALGETGSD
jgi:hypothetical protein